jgi:hypothetical protein
LRRRSQRSGLDGASNETQGTGLSSDQADDATSEPRQRYISRGDHPRPDDGCSSTIEPARRLAQARGNTFTTLTDDEYARWGDAMKPVIQEWIKEVNAKGGDGEKLLQSAR